MACLWGWDIELMQKWCNSIANALELCLSCISPLIGCLLSSNSDPTHCYAICNVMLWQTVLSGDSADTGIILGRGSANERRHYTVMPALIGWACTQNNPCDALWYYDRPCFEDGSTDITSCYESLCYESIPLHLDHCFESMRANKQAAQWFNTFQCWHRKQKAHSCLLMHDTHHLNKHINGLVQDCPVTPLCQQWSYCSLVLSHQQSVTYMELIFLILLKQQDLPVNLNHLRSVKNNPKSIILCIFIINTVIAHRQDHFAAL